VAVFNILKNLLVLNYQMLLLEYPLLEYCGIWNFKDILSITAYFSCCHVWKYFR